MARPLQQLGIGGIVGKTCFVRMNSHTRPYSRIFGFPVVFFCQLNPAVGGLRPVAISDCQIGFDAVLFRARQDFFAIAVVALAFEMGVRVNEHRLLVVTDDWKPYLFKTTDYGKKWVSVAGNLPAKGNINALREDYDNPNLLFAGTEFGLYVT